MGLLVWALVETRPDPQPDARDAAEFVRSSPRRLACLNTFYCCWKSGSSQAAPLPALDESHPPQAEALLEQSVLPARLPLRCPATVTEGKPRKRGFGLELTGIRGGLGGACPELLHQVRSCPRVMSRGDVLRAAAKG